MSDESNLVTYKTCPYCARQWRLPQHDAGYTELSASAASSYYRHKTLCKNRTPYERRAKAIADFERRTREHTNTFVIRDNFNAPGMTPPTDRAEQLRARREAKKALEEMATKRFPIICEYATNRLEALRSANDPAEIELLWQSIHEEARAVGQASDKMQTEIETYLHAAIQTVHLSFAPILEAVNESLSRLNQSLIQTLAPFASAPHSEPVWPTIDDLNVMLTLGVGNVDAQTAQQEKRVKLVTHPNWDIAPDDVRFWAFDDNRLAYWYMERPFGRDGVWVVDLAANPEGNAYLMGYALTDCDWQDSLQERPKDTAHGS